MPPQDYPLQSLFHPLVSDTSILIVQLLDVDSLVRLRCTSRTADVYVSVTIKRRLCMLFAGQLKYGAFLRTVDSLGGLVSGVAALHILFPSVTPPPRIIDVYVPQGKLDDFIEHLKSVQGMTHGPPPQSLLEEPRK
ncbi:hypothetical protein C8Q76DRAFT_802385 [Earliella scabrosa]|nr:hypothetical protein C8Q76DRAFT_802385 [Earliella scabrosa]